VLRVGSETARFVVIDTSLDFTKAYTIWAGLLGGIALTLSTHGTDQYLVQRLLSAKSQKDASTGLVLSGFIVFAQFILFLLIGVMLFTYYQQTPLPQALTRPDQILPIFVVSELKNGLAGFIVAAIVAAALSPSLNAMAATTISDFYLPYINPSADQATQMRVSKQATVAWGVVQLLVAIGAQFMNRSVLDAGLAVLSFASGAVLGAFLLGTLAPSVRERDTFAGMIAGLMVMTAVWWGTSIAFTWYVLIGAVTTCVVAMAVRTLLPAPAPAR
jgi:solute:Na+ symporter, SSS family